MPTFMERKRDELRARGIDPLRLPPGQYVTDRFPVLHLGPVPDYDSLDDWTLDIGGDAVDRSVTLTWDALRSLPSRELTVDIHCVTKWSRLDVMWRGVMLADVLAPCGVRPDAATLVASGDHGYSSSIAWSELTDHDAMLAWEVDGGALAAEHGWPLRLVVPHLYFWKSVKWLRRLDVWSGARAGFWEERGYHVHGDPFSEERYWGDDTTAPGPHGRGVDDESRSTALSRPLRTLLDRAVTNATGSLTDDVAALRDACALVLGRVLDMPDAPWSALIGAAAARGRWDRWRIGGLLVAEHPDSDGAPEATRDLLAELADELSVVGGIAPEGWEGGHRAASADSAETLDGKRRRSFVFGLERLVELADGRDAAGLDQLADSLAALDPAGADRLTVDLIHTAASDVASVGAVRAATRESLARALEDSPFAASVRRLDAVDDQGGNR
jgi:DMSO/TMAO reductase YedYZ molybdopterin-dependent catalytic subunit